MCLFDFKGNIEEVVERSLLHRCPSKPLPKLVEDIRKSYGTESCYTIAPHQTWEGLQHISVIFPPSIVSANSNPDTKQLADDYKEKLKENFLGYIQSAIALRTIQGEFCDNRAGEEYSVTFHVPEITELPELDVFSDAKKNVYLSDYFKEKQYVASAKTIHITADKETREITNKGDTITRLSETIDAFVDAAFEFDVNFHQAVNTVADKFSLTNK